MDISEFVSEALRQILDGIAKAQTLDLGDNINAKAAAGTFGGNIVNMGAHGVYTRVDFDIAVSAESTGKAGGILKVFGFGIEGGGERKAGIANRISFSVPVRLPDGDPQRAEEIRKRTAENMERLTRQAGGRRGDWMGE